MPNQIHSAAISDDGSLIALLGRAGGFRAPALERRFRRRARAAAPSDATFVTIDPHGRYLAVGTRQTTLHFFNRYGRPAGTLGDDAFALASLFRARPADGRSARRLSGCMVGVAFEPGRTQGRLEPEIIWQDRLMSNVGRLAVDGEGGMILASCYTLGIQRFDLRGATKARITWAARSRTPSPTSPAVRSPPRPSRASSP